MTDKHFADKTFADCHKNAKFAEGFLPRKFPAIRYAHTYRHTHTHTHTHTHAHTHTHSQLGQSVQCAKPSHGGDEVILQVQVCEGR